MLTVTLIGKTHTFGRICLECTWSSLGDFDALAWMLQQLARPMMKEVYMKNAFGKRKEKIQPSLPETRSCAAKGSLRVPLGRTALLT